MKTRKGLRDHDTDELRKAKRLEPMRKSGKERHALYGRLNDDEEEDLHVRRRSASPPAANRPSTTSTTRKTTNKNPKR